MVKEIQLDLDINFESANSAIFADIHHSKPKGWRTDRKRADRSNSRNSSVVIHNYGASGADYQASW